MPQDLGIGSPLGAGTSNSNCSALYARSRSLPVTALHSKCSLSPPPNFISRHHPPLSPRSPSAPPTQSPSRSHNRHASPEPLPLSHPHLSQKSDIHSAAPGSENIAARRQAPPPNAESSADGYTPWSSTHTACSA